MGGARVNALSQSRVRKNKRARTLARVLLELCERVNLHSLASDSRFASRRVLSCIRSVLYLECYLIAVVIRTRAPRSAIVHAYAGALERLAVTAT